MSHLDEIVRKRRWNAVDASALVTAWREAGGPLAAFAREVGVGEERLRRWRVKLDADAGRGGGAADVLFVELRPRVAPVDAGVEVLVGGRVVRVRTGFDALTLQRVVETLATLQC